MTSWSFLCAAARAVVRCFAYGLGGFEKVQILFFRARVQFRILVFSILKGKAISSKSPTCHTRYLPMVSPCRYFFRLLILRKRLAIQVIQVSGVVSGPVFFAISTGCRNLAKHWGVAGTAYAYGLP